jgi:Ca2+-binding EF-hand superfamily protein
LAVVFKQFDKNNDGRLGPDEIQALMRHIGRPVEEAKELMRKIDDDGDGVISQDEFATASAMGHLSGDQAEIKKAFDLFDVNKDGEVTTAELEKLCEFLTPSAAKQLIGEVDANKGMPCLAFPCHPELY